MSVGDEIKKLLLAALVLTSLAGTGAALTDITGDWFTGSNGNPATGYDYTDIISANIEQISSTELKATTIVNANIPGFGWHGYRWFLDTDKNSATGQTGYLFNDIGADYWVEVAGSSGTPNPSIAIWKTGYGLVKRITNYNVQGNKVEITFSISDIGNPESFYWVADTTDGISVNDHIPNSGHGPVTLSSQPSSNFSVSNLNMNGQGNYVEVNTGATVSGTVSYTIWDSSCPGCIKQLVIGLNDDPKTCIFNDIPGAYPGKSGTASFTFTAPTSPGTYTVGWTEDAMYGCNDAKNNFPGKSKTTLGTIKVADASPSIAISSPSNGQTFTTSTITVSGTASDDIGLSKVEVKIGSGSWQFASGTTSWNKQVTLSSGSNTITARATDSSGNPAEVSVIVSHNPPVALTTGNISVTSSPPGAAVYLDGSYQGKTPKTITGVAAGSRYIELKLDGYSIWSDSIDVTAGSTSYVSAQLASITPTVTTTPAPTTQHPGITTTEIKANIIASETIKNNLAASKPVKYTLSSPEHGIYEIYVTGKENENNIAIRVEALKGSSELVTTPAPGKVYKNLNIIADSKNIKEALIKFKVENSWIKSNDLDYHEVRLLRWNGADWIQLDTSKKSIDAEFSYYEAKTSGFSTFAISGIKGISQPTTKPTTSESLTQDQTNWGLVGGVVLAIILIGAVVLRSRKSKIPAPTIPSTFPPELKPNYTNIELIGEGGFAKVFKANRKKDNKTVAVKIPRLDEKTGRAFLNEIMAWHNLNHENIVKLFDANVHPVPYLEMEYIDGVEISGNRIRDLEHYPKPLEEERAVEIIKGISEGLRHAHSKGVVHRDLKPLNVLITSGSKPKITDFGLAKLSAESKLSTLKGYSPLYAAPEQLDTAEYGKPDERTDIYQLGVIFYELLTGKLPYEGYTQSEVSTKIITPAIQPTKPSVHNPELEKFDDVVMRCLAKKKEDRFKNVHEFLGQLEVASEKESLVEQLKKTLDEQKETLKKSRSSEEIVKSKRMVVETLGRLAIIYAEHENKTELFNVLEDLKFYTIKNLEELSKATEQLEFLIKNESRVSEQFVSGIKNLVHKIRREYEL